MGKRRQSTEALERDRRREFVATFAAKGRTQREIVKMLAALNPPIVVDQSTVSRDLKAVRKQWRESARKTIDEHKARSLAELDAVIKEAFAAHAMKPQDTRPLNTVVGAIGRKSRMLGLDQPVKHEHGLNGETLRKSLREMSEDELLGILALASQSD